MDWIGARGCLYKDPVSGVTAATLNCIPALITNILGWLITFAGIVSLLFIIVSGFRYITSGGDPKQLDQARKTIIYSILGLVLVLCAFLIVETIAKIGGVPCINAFQTFGFAACK